MMFHLLLLFQSNKHQGGCHPSNRYSLHWQEVCWKYHYSQKCGYLSSDLVDGRLLPHPQPHWGSPLIAVIGKPFFLQPFTHLLQSVVSASRGRQLSRCDLRTHFPSSSDLLSKYSTLKEFKIEHLTVCVLPVTSQGKAGDKEPDKSIFSEQHPV